MLKKIIVAVALVAGVAIAPVSAQAETMMKKHYHHYHHHRVMREHMKAHSGQGDK